MPADFRRVGVIKGPSRNGAFVFLAYASDFDIIIVTTVVPLFWNDESLKSDGVCLPMSVWKRASVPRGSCSVIGGMGIPGCWASYF